MAGPREVSLRTLRTARVVLVGVVLLYVWVGEKDGPAPRPVNLLLRIAVSVLAASIIPTGCVGESCNALKTDWHANRVRWPRFGDGVQSN